MTPEELITWLEGHGHSWEAWAPFEAGSLYRFAVRSERCGFELSVEDVDCDRAVARTMAAVSALERGVLA